MLANLITWIYNAIGNFGCTIVLVVVASQLLMIPLQMFARKNSKAKAACAPEIREIRKKYNASQLGVSMDDAPDMSPEVKRMSHDERDEAMANEISAVYKKNHYHMWTGWIPTVVNLVLIIWMWRGIQAASPEGFYRMTVWGTEGNIWQILLFVSMPVMSLISGIIDLCKTVRKDKGKPTFKASIIAGCVAGAFSLGLSVWITFAVSAALAIALLTLQLWGIIRGVVVRLTAKDPDTAAELS